ncbi:hypothetical protein RN001_008127 [Aquatica leii]|uniref:Uncharacterized protein n=1 Tax=Aquatica leii TaxID=1421715 RepID=A0AAN7PES3_9COLE|nr:hypothetical protein RN001_008127 [Aquatica leii]
MLSPEIWNFKVPHSSFKIEKQQISNDSCFQTIQRLPYNHLISVVLPNTLRTPEIICDSLKTDCEYYRISNISLDELTNTKFIDNFLKKGSFSALSIDTRIDVDDCVCLTVDGLMVLSLRKETYETFGLEGVASNFYCKSKERYIVSINLLSKTLKLGTKKYERTNRCLSRLGNFCLIMSWEPPDDICPSSIAKYFFDLGNDVKLCVPDFNVRTSYSVKVPDLENLSEFTEWLGMFSLETTLENTDDYLTTYETPIPCQEYGQVKFLQSRGFFTHSQIKKLLEELMTFAKTEDVPWVSLYVQGFSDAAVGWNAQEHQYYTNGDNSYLIVITSDTYWVAYQSCSRKRYKYVNNK